MSEFECPGCGTGLPLGVDYCTGCGAPIAWSYCGACLAANAPGAGACIACGRSLGPLAPTAMPDRIPCPKCDGPMRRRELQTYQIHQCERCRGAFVDHHTLELLQQGDAPVAGADAPARLEKPQRPTTPVVYIRCPGCAEVMNRVQFGRQSGIVVDVCREHGTFFDHVELERARDWVAARGGVQEDPAASRRKKSTRKSSRPAVAPVTADAAMLAVARAIAHWLRGAR